MIEEALVGQDRFDETNPERLVGSDDATGQDQVGSTAGADEAGQPLRAARARDDADVDLRLAEIARTPPRPAWCMPATVRTRRPTPVR